MKKRILTSVICALFVFIWVFNVIRVNYTTEKVPEKIYSMGEWVEYGNNYYDNSTEIKDGYSIKVSDAKVLEYDDFLKQNNITVHKDEELFKPQYLYDVTVIIKNKNNTESGINMLDTTLNSVNNIMQIEFDVFDALYPQLCGSVSFSVKPGTEMKFHFPFAVANSDFEKVCDFDYLKSNTFFLNLSQYPTEMSIEINI